ncbi:MAG: ABC transporter permease [Xanthobacteraceae bacterium]|nr:ABC transporter permease [Xanthobacteraceae bacterium]
MKRSLFGKRFKIVLGAGIIVAMCLLAALAPYLAPYDPLQQDLLRRLKPPFFMAGGTAKNLLGTDNYGRDLLSRLIFGTQTSIMVGTASMALSCILGAIAGLIAGYKGGRIEQLIMRFADAHMAFPDVLFAIIMAAAFGGSTFNLILVLGISGWMIYARLVFGLVRSLKHRSFVEAAVSYGGGDRYVMSRHLLPQIVPILTVVATLQVAQMILQEAALSFLGLGLPPPAPTWGNILAEGRDRMFGAPWIANCAGIAIILIVFGINMFGNGLREYLDPQAKQR